MNVPRACRNRALLFQTGAPAPPAAESEPARLDGGGTSLDGFKLFAVNPDGSTGDEIRPDNHPPELRIATTRADGISQLQPLRAKETAGTSAIDDLYEKIRRNKEMDAPAAPAHDEGGYEAILNKDAGDMAEARRACVSAFFCT